MPDPFTPSPEAQLGADLMRLQEGWEELGIDADDFLKCAVCHQFIPDLVENLKDPPTDLCTCEDSDAS